jgi:hypothetical protein
MRLSSGCITSRQDGMILRSADGPARIASCPRRARGSKLGIDMHMSIGNPGKYVDPNGHLPLLPLLGVFLFLATLPGIQGHMK